MARLLVAAALALILISCLSPGPLLPQGTGVVDAGAAADGSVAPASFERVTATGFQRLVHADPLTTPPDFVPMPRPDVVYEFEGQFVEAAVRVVDAGIFEFDVPADSGYFVKPIDVVVPFANRTPWFFSTERALDLGVTVSGRLNGGVGTPGPMRIVIDAGNSLGQLFDVASPHAPASGQANCATPIGATSCSGSFYWFGSRSVRIVPSRGDVTYVSQFTDDYPQTRQYSLVRRGTTRTVDFEQADASYLEVELHVPDASFAMTVDVPSFHAPTFLPAVHPNAAPFEGSNPLRAVLVWTLEHPWHVSRAFGAVPLGELSLFQAQLFADAGLTVFRVEAAPLPPEERWRAATELRVQYRVPLTFNGRSVDVGAMVSGTYELHTSGTMLIGADVFPPTNVRIDGKDIPPAAPITAGSVTPELLWSEPTSGLLPEMYRVVIFEIEATADGGVRSFFGSAFLTTSSRLRVPPGVLSPGHTYYAQVSSIRHGGPMSAARPFEIPKWFREVPVVTNVWRAPP